MPHKRSDAAAVFDMLAAAEGAMRHIAGKSRQNYEEEELVRDAVERKIEIIGEAARRTTKEFREQHPQVPWRVNNMAGKRRPRFRCACPFNTAATHTPKVDEKNVSDIFTFLVKRRSATMLSTSWRENSKGTGKFKGDANL
jgi:uncharacterized protein with HEPN domain